MPRNLSNDSEKLSRLMPGLANSDPVVNSSERAEKHGDRKATANAQQKIGAHILCMEELINRPGVESRVWNSAVNELTINQEDIPETYWRQQEQLARDNGYGNFRIDDSFKIEITKQLRDAQRTGLESWRNYLEQIGDQYPLWFKFYAWDGMSKMGIFDKKKGVYAKRSKGTVAPYPTLNPASLANAINEQFNGEEPSDDKLKDIVDSGSFNKLYSYMLWIRKQ